MLKSNYATPKQLIQELQSRKTQARQELHRLVDEPLGRLIDKIIAEHNLPHDRNVLLDHARHSAETFLRTRRLSDFDDLSWPAFLAAVLTHEAKTAFQPHASDLNQLPGEHPLPNSSAYQSYSLFLPSEKIGDYWFSGDWIGAGISGDRSLWIMVADVTGHGYSAYLVARGLPDVWDVCWSRLPNDALWPVDLLKAMHDMLQDCLPENVYVEATLARFGPDGQAVIAPAGGSRLFLRSGKNDKINWFVLEGGWLGLLPPQEQDQRTWNLDAGDEILLGTDGLFDQLCGYGSWEDALIELFAGAAAPSSLFQHVKGFLEESLRKHPQHDDIAMVTLQRLADSVYEAKRQLPAD